MIKAVNTWHIDNERDKKRFFKFLPYMLLIALVINAVSVYRDTNADIYFMMAEARWWISHHFDFFTIDPLSMHEGFKASFEKWLCCLIYYGMYNLFEKIGLSGWIGICVVEAIINSLLAFVLVRICRMSGISKNWSYISAYCILICLLFFRLARPQIFTYLFLALEIYLLEKSKKDLNPKLLLWLIPIAIAEINIHSTQYPILFIFIFPYLIDFLDKGGYPYKKQLFFTCIGMGLSMLINPYGINGMTYIFKSYNKYTKKIFDDLVMECTPLKITDPLLFSGVLFCFTLSVVLLAKHSISHRAALLNIITSLMGFSAVRNVAFLLVSSVLLWIYSVRLFNSSEKWHSLVIHWMDSLMTRVFIAVLITTWILEPPIFVRYRYMSLTTKVETEDADSTVNDDYYKHVAQEMISRLAEEKDVTGKTIFCHDDVGSFAEWKGLKPYMDTRIEIFMKIVNGREDIIQELTDMQTDARTFLRQNDFDYVVVLPKEVFNMLIEDDNYGYKIIDEQDGVYLLEKES